MAPKEEKPKVKSEGEATEVIWAYLQSQNRPFNTTMLYENLHKAVGKTLVTKVLEALESSGKVTGKPYGKQKIYWANQDNVEALDVAQLSERDAELKALEEERDQQRSLTQSTAAELRAALEGPTDAEAIEQLEVVERRLVALRKRVGAAEDGQRPAVDASKMAAIRAKYDASRTEWRKRKRLFKEVCSEVEEGTGKRFKELAPIVGLETDEDAGVELEKNRTIELSAKPASKTW